MSRPLSCTYESRMILSAIPEQQDCRAIWCLNRREMEAPERHAATIRSTTYRLRAPFPFPGQVALLWRGSYLRSSPVSFFPSLINRLAFSRSLFLFALVRIFSLPLPIDCLPNFDVSLKRRLAEAVPIFNRPQSRSMDSLCSAFGGQDVIRP